MSFINQLVWNCRHNIKDFEINCDFNLNLNSLGQFRKMLAINVSYTPLLPFGITTFMILARSVNWKAGQKHICCYDRSIDLFHGPILVGLNLKNHTYVSCGTEIYLLHILPVLKQRHFYKHITTRLNYIKKNVDFLSCL